MKKEKAKSATQFPQKHSGLFLRLISDPESIPDSFPMDHVIRFSIFPLFLIYVTFSFWLNTGSHEMCQASFQLPFIESLAFASHCNKLYLYNQTLSLKYH